MKTKAITTPYMMDNSEDEEINEDDDYCCDDWESLISDHNDEEDNIFFVNDDDDDEKDNCTQTKKQLLNFIQTIAPPPVFSLTKPTTIYNSHMEENYLEKTKNTKSTVNLVSNTLSTPLRCVEDNILNDEDKKSKTKECWHISWCIDNNDKNIFTNNIKKDINNNKFDAVVKRNKQPPTSVTTKNKKIIRHTIDPKELGFLTVGHQRYNNNFKNRVDGNGGEGRSHYHHHNRETRNCWVNNPIKQKIILLGKNRTPSTSNISSNNHSIISRFSKDDTNIITSNPKVSLYQKNIPNNDNKFYSQGVVPTVQRRLLIKKHPSAITNSIQNVSLGDTNHLKRNIEIDDIKMTKLASTTAVNHTNSRGGGKDWRRVNFKSL